jgi:hypothetical protein
MSRTTYLLLLVGLLLFVGYLYQERQRQNSSLDLRNFEAVIDPVEADLAPEEFESQQLSPDDSLNQLEAEVEGTVIFEEDFSGL